MSPSPRLVAARPARPLPPLDAVQRRAVDHPEGAGHLLVVGAPGSGKTSTAMAVLEQRIAAAPPGAEVLMLAAGRRAAARVRDEVTARLSRTVGEVRVRTPASIAFSILRTRASLLGEPPPTLITGPEQDAILADLLAGHRLGEGVLPRWPERVPESALGLRAFRDELRDLLMRAAEAGLSPAGLASLGRRRGREEWVAAASVLREYEQVLQLGQLTPDRGERYDAAVIIDEAVAALRSWSRVLPGSAPPRFRTVVVDDYQESTMATARLLRTFADDGAQIFLFGDADAAVHGFRGGTAALVDAATAGRDQPGGFSATRIVLPTVWRQAPALRAATSAVTQCLAATGGVTHRTSPSAGDIPHEAGGAPSAGQVRRGAPPTMVTGDLFGEEAEADGGHVLVGDLRAASLGRDGLAADGRAGGGLPRPADPNRGGSEPGPADARPTGVEVSAVRTRAEEAALIARLMREEHLHHGTGYDEMAVIVRGGAQAGALRRRLATAGVPVAAAAAETALRDSPAVGPLLLGLGVALGSDLSPDAAVALLMSPLAGGDRLDAVSLRALRRALRSAAGAEDARSTDELLVELLTDPARCASLPPRVRPGAARISSMLTAASAAAGLPGATAETVLWAAWEASGRAEPWRRAALAGGPAGDRADRDLDAVLELFRAAEQFADRNPAARPAEFLRFVQGQDLPSDSLAARGGREHAVHVLTAAGAAGAEWSVVAVAGVQEDVWPDLRVRDSLLGAQELAEVAAGRGAVGRGTAGRREVWEARHEVLQDELRAFAVAVSRARRRLVVTAVRDGDLAPSPFLDLVDPGAPADHARALRAPDAPLDLRGLVAVLRAELPAGRDAAAAAALLADLAAAGVPGADPATWAQARPESTEEPLWAAGEPVDLSPSSLETAQTCALRWALERVGGRRAPGAEQNLGTLVHAIAADLPHGSYSELAAELDRRWPELGLDDGWRGRRQREIADEMIRRLAGYFAGRPGPVDVERAVEAQIGRVLLRGRVDRVEHLPDGSVRIVDLKTGASAKSAPDVEADPQLGAYQAAVRTGALGEQARPGGAALVYVGINKEAAQRHQGALEDDWAERMLEDLAGTVASSSFAATVGDGCRTCPVRTSCPARPEGGRVCS